MPDKIVDYMLVPISDGSYAIVDSLDYPLIRDFRWYRDEAGYARTNIHGGNRKIAAPRMHRLIVGDVDRRSHIDHINGNKLDNRRSNLRVVTCSQNLMNRGPQRNSLSGYKGVMWSKDKRKWRAEIQYENKRKHIGYFDDKEEAARAYNEAALLYHGEFAYQNPV